MNESMPAYLSVRKLDWTIGTFCPRKFHETKAFQGSRIQNISISNLNCYEK
jgi:hypothetical protein